MHALSALVVHTAERDQDGIMTIAYGEFLLPPGEHPPHLTSPLQSDPARSFEVTSGQRAVMGTLGRSLFSGQYMVQDPSHFYVHYILQFQSMSMVRSFLYSFRFRLFTLAWKSYSLIALLV